MTPAIDIRSVVKRYGRFEALRGVSLAVEQGEFFGLLGPNGAGKTSLISLVAGLNRPTSGSVSVMGHDVVGDYRAARRALGVVPQELVFDPFFSVRETLRLTSGYYGLRRNDAWIDEILENLDLADKADANMRALSGGMKRRVLVAQALVHRPPVIVLTTHYLEEAQELCGRIAMLKQGRVVALDRTSSLLGRFGGGTVSLRLSGAPLPDALRPLLAGEPGPDGRIGLRIDDWQALEPVLGALRAAGCRIDELELAHTDLEDVFVRIMAGDAGASGAPGREAA
jgi:ABC-2 type transport system ATP-binding protein